MTGDKGERDLRDGLLSDLHGQAVIWIKDGRVDGSNEPARELVGFDPRGRSVGEVFDEQSARKIERLIASRGKAGRTELQIEGTAAPPRLAAFAAVRGSGDELLLIGSSKGITYPEEAGQRLFSAIEDLAASLRKLGREVRDAKSAKESLERIENLRDVFVTALAHDLRSPLNAVLLAEELLERTEGHLGSRHMASHRKMVERNIRAALELVDSLVGAARLDAATPRLMIKKISPGDVARQWLDTLALAASAADVSLQMTGGDVPDVYADPVRLGEVFSNLLSNAIRHSPTGGQVTLEMAMRGEELMCCVSDQGPGIPVSVRGSIFDKFFQGPSLQGMSGLGLYICRRIVELHGGQIWVEDNSPKGSRFVFTLPITQDRKSWSSDAIA